MQDIRVDPCRPVPVAEQLLPGPDILSSLEQIVAKSPLLQGVEFSRITRYATAWTTRSHKALCDEETANFPRDGNARGSLGKRNLAAVAKLFRRRRKVRRLAVTRRRRRTGLRGR